MTQHPEEGTLHAYIDGELSRGEAAALQAHVAECRICAAALAEARGLVAAASRAISALDVAPSSARRMTAPPTVAIPTRPKIRAPIFRASYARAAALLLLVGGTAVVLGRSGTLERKAAPGTESLTVDATVATQVAPTAAPEAAAATGAADAVTGKAVASTGGAAAVAADAKTRNRRAEPAATASAPVSLAEDQSVSSANSPKRLASPSDTVSRPSVAAVAPASPPPARPTEMTLSEMTLSEVVVTGASSTPARVTRYRTKDGAILTLTEESSRASFAEEATAGARRTAAQSPQRVVPQTMSGAAAAPVNSYRWTNADQGRRYTLTGPLSVAELEALSKRLGELERLP